MKIFYNILAASILIGSYTQAIEQAPKKIQAVFTKEDIFNQQYPNIAKRFAAQKMSLEAEKLNLELEIALGGKLNLSTRTITAVPKICLGLYALVHAHALLLRNISSAAETTLSILTTQQSPLECFYSGTATIFGMALTTVVYSFLTSIGHNLASGGLDNIQHSFDYKSYNKRLLNNVVKKLEALKLEKQHCIDELEEINCLTNSINNLQ
ncbi:MAG: hypothetical protein WC707_05595 [Candidatus Babeliaceae bacterium]|jgi:hypothetical protein